MSDFLKGDIIFGNLEGCFLNVGEPTKQCKDSTKCYVFRMPERYAPYLKDAGFDIIDGDSAIVPVMLYDAKLSQTMANELLKQGIYVIGFFVGKICIIDFICYI